MFSPVWKIPLIIAATPPHSAVTLMFPLLGSCFGNIRRKMSIFLCGEVLLWFCPVPVSEWNICLHRRPPAGRFLSWRPRFVISPQRSGDIDSVWDTIIQKKEKSIIISMCFLRSCRQIAVRALCLNSNLRRICVWGGAVGAAVPPHREVSGSDPGSVGVLLVWRLHVLIAWLKDWDKEGGNTRWLLQIQTIQLFYMCRRQDVVWASCNCPCVPVSLCPCVSLSLCPSIFKLKRSRMDERPFVGVSPLSSGIFSSFLHDPLIGWMEIICDLPVSAFSWPLHTFF